MITLGACVLVLFFLAVVVYAVVYLHAHKTSPLAVAIKVELAALEASGETDVKKVIAAIKAKL